MNSTSLEQALKRPISAPTGRNPGYGVLPLQNSSDGEKQRFKRDYFNAMREKFGSDELALEAFIHGAGRLSKRLKQDTRPADEKLASKPDNERKPNTPKTMAKDWQGSSHVMPAQNAEWEGSVHMHTKPVKQMGKLEQLLTGIGAELGDKSLSLMENLGAKPLFDTAFRQGKFDTTKTLNKQLLNDLSKTEYGNAGQSLGGVVPYLSGNTLSSALTNGGVMAMAEDSLKPVGESLAGFGAGKLVGGLFTPRPEIKELLKKDIVPSVGQALGGNYDRAEKLFNGSMLFGDTVRKARNRGFKEMGSKFREYEPDEYSLLAKILGIKAAMHPYLSIPAYIAAEIGSGRAMQKALLGGYPAQKPLSIGAKGAAVAGMERQEKK